MKYRIELEFRDYRTVIVEGRSIEEALEQTHGFGRKFPGGIYDAISITPMEVIAEQKPKKADDEQS